MTIEREISDFHHQITREGSTVVLLSFSYFPSIHSACALIEIHLRYYLSTNYIIFHFIVLFIRLLSFDDASM